MNNNEILANMIYSYMPNFNMLPSYKNGGIHIKKKNRGKFKAAAKRAGMSVQAYANKVLKKGSKASKQLKKRAQFAKNAAKWHH
ncbi:transcriptional regulator [uncultured phage cr118_1]|jgi:Zn-dependent oligopeptidase|uniref:Transcriptional regulator n=1 Tax=uncultured phage cr118_1 TaxID=2772063 RepID=A0A7M1RVJ8_9CAUD|nr:transcriptional regulator [uncultured phage cr118_1]QOR58433.1 transcriptional regulator [uncultured phage cr118_1]DAI23411.1 MAG TPA: antitoxin [Caudoviricetes sp.]